MKAIIVFLLISCTCLKAGETNKVTSTVSERLEMPDGVVVSSMEQFARGSDVVLFTERVRSTNSQMMVQSRTYIVHGDVVMSEMAVKRGNIQDALLIFGRAGTKNWEVYRRKPDGTVRPASASLLQAVAARDLLREQLIKAGDTAPIRPEVEAKLKEVDQMMETALKADGEI